MKIIKETDYWKGLTSHPEILEMVVPRTWGERKSYCVAAIPCGNYVAQEVEKMIGQPVIFANSQNLDLRKIEEHVLFLARCRSDELGRDEVLFLGTKLNEFPYAPLRGELSRGDIYVSPDGKKFLVTGAKGDPYSPSSMGFRPLSEEEAEDLIAAREKKRIEKEKRRKEEQKAEEEKIEREYLQYRSSIRGITESFGLMILERKNVGAGMPPAHMICREKLSAENNGEPQYAFEVVAAFCSPEGPYSFLRSVIKFARQTSGGQINREVWESLDIDQALSFALDEQERYEEKKGRR